MAQSDESMALELETIESELAGLPAAIAAAIRTGEDAKLARLLIRERQLPLLIADRKSEALRQRIAEVEAQQADAIAEGARANEDERTAHEQLKQAQAAEKAATHSFGQARRRMYANTARREALAGQLGNLQAELAALGAE